MNNQESRQIHVQFDEIEKRVEQLFKKIESLENEKIRAQDGKLKIRLRREIQGQQYMLEQKEEGINMRFRWVLQQE